MIYLESLINSGSLWIALKDWVILRVYENLWYTLICFKILLRGSEILLNLVRLMDTLSTLQDSNRLRLLYILIDFERFWETLIDTERHCETMQDYGTLWEIFVTLQYLESLLDTLRDPGRLWQTWKLRESLKDFERFWETLIDSERHCETMQDYGTLWEIFVTLLYLESLLDTLRDPERLWQTWKLRESLKDFKIFWESQGD